MAAFRAKENAVDRPFDSSRMSFSHSHSWTDFIARAEGFKRESQLFFNDADMQQLHSSDGFWLWHVDYASSSFGMIPQTPPPPPPEWPAHSVKAPAKANAAQPFDVVTALARRRWNKFALSCVLVGRTPS